MADSAEQKETLQSSDKPRSLRRDISRRMVVVGLVGLVVAEAVAGGITWQTLSQGIHNIALAFAPPVRKPSPTVTSSSPCVSVAPTLLIFKDVVGEIVSPSQTVTIVNCGDTGTWSVSTVTDDGYTWLSADPSGGSLQKGASEHITITTSNLLPPQTYTGHLTFTIMTSKGKPSSFQVFVTFQHTTSPPACISTNTPSLTFIGIAGKSDVLGDTVILVNCGGTGMLSVTVTTVDGADWLSVGQMSSIFPFASQMAIPVTTTNVIANLPPGSYNGHLTITIRIDTELSSITVNVTLIIAIS